MNARSLLVFRLTLACTVLSACGGDDDESVNPDAGADAATATDAAATSDGADGGKVGVVTNPDITVAPGLYDGQVVAPWDKYCVATFTRPFSIKQKFQEDVTVLDVEQGDRYLLVKVSGLDNAGIAYISDTGAIDLGFQFDELGAPFTSSCGADSDEAVGVFVDTTLYAEGAHTTPLCELQAGQLLPGRLNYYSQDGGFLIESSSLAAVCDGVTMGYVSEAEVVLSSGRFFRPPLMTIEVPAK